MWVRGYLPSNTKLSDFEIWDIAVDFDAWSERVWGRLIDILSQREDERSQELFRPLGSKEIVFLILKQGDMMRRRVSGGNSVSNTGRQPISTLR